MHHPPDRSSLRPRGDGAVVAHDFRHDQPGRRSEPCDSTPVVCRRPDLARYERAVTAGVVRRPSYEALRLHDPALELGMAPVDARVDHRYADGLELREHVEGAEDPVLRQVPLPRRERVVRSEGGLGGGGCRKCGGYCDHQGKPPQAATTLSTLETPTANPFPAITRARYDPGVNSTRAVKLPTVSVVVRDTVAQPLWPSRWTWTAAPGSTGRSCPLSECLSLAARMRTSGATDSRTIPLRIFPVDSR